jgi:hypothetical protein
VANSVINKAFNIIIKEYNYTYAVSAGSSIIIKASDFGFDTPSGYTPIALTKITTGNNNVVFRMAQAVNSGNCLVVRNVGTSDVPNAVASIGIAYAPSNMVRTE